MQRNRQRASSQASKTVRRKPPTVDYCYIAISYAEDAIADTKGETYGKRIRQAAKRFIADLKRAQRRRRPPFVWSPEQANRYCSFIEQLPHVEGTWNTATIQLEPSQIFFVCQLFGFRRHDGSRRFTTALYAVARKNAKSTLAAAIMLACLCLEAETGPQILSAATTGDQARIVWNIARRMVEVDSELRAAFDLEAFANSIARYEVGGAFRPINAKASTQDGLNPSALCFDELHAHKTRDLFDVLRSASGARRNPLQLYTTTEGYENPGPWQEVRRFAFQVLDGILEADHFLALYYAIDEDDNDFDETCWIKANPLLGVSVSLDKLREYAKEAKLLPGSLAEFQIKRLNRRAASGDAWIRLPKWRRCGKPVELEKLLEEPCWAGLDLASSLDLAAWRIVWYVDDKYYTWGRFWTPAAAARTRTERGSAPYATWIAEGWITELPGEVLDYRTIKADILEDAARFKLQEVAFDRWNASQMVSELQDEGLPMVEFAQGPKSFNPAMQALEAAYISGKFCHGGNPVLTWNATNLVPRRDANLNLAPDRKRSADKIDGMVALLMAIGRASLAVQGQGDLVVSL